MHWRGHSRVMQQLAHYDDVVADVRRELLERVDAAEQAGVDPGNLVLDPGLGFAKTAEHNWALLAHLDALIEIGLPVLIGASRKSFLGMLLAGTDGTPRRSATASTPPSRSPTYAALRGVWGVRVHEVRANVDAALAVRRRSSVRRFGRADDPERPDVTRSHHADRPAGTRPPRRLRRRTPRRAGLRRRRRARARHGRRRRLRRHRGHGPLRRIGAGAGGGRRGRAGESAGDACRAAGRRLPGG